MSVVIIGASEDSTRFSFRAQKMLTQHCYSVVPVSLSAKSVLGEVAYQSVSDIPDSQLPVDTVTVYVNPRNFDSIVDEVVALGPRRIIFNPGSEHAEAASAFQDAGIEVEHACTLVMLELGQF